MTEVGGFLQEACDNDELLWSLVEFDLNNQVSTYYWKAGSAIY